MTTQDTYPMPAHGWTCFHCGETFKTPGGAQNHFGGNVNGLAGCQIKVGEERGLLMALRKAEERAERAERERDTAVANAYEVGKRDGASAQRKRDAGIADEERDCAATDLYDVRQQLGELYDPNCYGAGYDAGRKAAAEQIAAAIRQQDKGEPG
jgi:hypothetical protein